MSSTKHIQLHVKSKPTFTIACTILIVIMTMYAIPNRTLKVLKPIKTNNRNKIFNARAKLGYLTLLFKLLPSVSFHIKFAVVRATFEVVFTNILDFFCQ